MSLRPIGLFIVDCIFLYRITAILEHDVSSDLCLE